MKNPPTRYRTANGKHYTISLKEALIGSVNMKRPPLPTNISHKIWAKLWKQSNNVEDKK